ncbi:hypothetical protein [Endozoicomonas numazuensis]|uniref:Spore coat protein U domain-containing protein n=1 Tax=Endozoicomonas numazuensis TaxID=1137799 RepID=A0A081NLQ6_9GAMM|nr:hypothetical protein [Endozoicomonas numazuensis]KEQ19379.1 hypothetical protein GZ78_05305 [Endozoicomonas numazuensis]
MDFSSITCRSLLASLLTLIALPTYSAQQGNIGKTSTGSFSIRLVIQPSLQTSIATQSSTQINDQTSTVAIFNKPEPLCIKGTGISQYSVATEGSGTQGSYSLTDGQRSYNYEIDLWSSDQKPYDLHSGQNSSLINTIPRNANCDADQTGFMVKIPEPSAQQPLEGSLRLIISAE